MNAYSDMLALPRPISRRHPQMRRADRAKQFGAFDPLTGFSQAIRDKEREVEANVDSETERITVTPEDDI